MSTIEPDAMLGEDSSTDTSTATTSDPKDNIDAMSRIYDQLEAGVDERDVDPKKDAIEPVEAKAPAPAPVDPAPARTEEPTPEPDDQAKTYDVAKPPRMWGAAAKEVYAALPDVAKQEIQKREREVDGVLRQTAQDRQISESAKSVLYPHMEYLRQINVPPWQAVKEVMDLGRQLHSGGSEEKAGVIAQLIKQYKVDLGTLDNLLTTQITRPAPPPEYTEMQQRLQQLEQQNQTAYQQAQATANQQTQAEVAAFAEKNEFVPNVRADMALLLQSGRASSLQDAYDMACRMSPEVTQVLEQRKQRDAVKVKAGTTSLNGSGPRSTPDAKPAKYRTARDAVEAAWDQLAGE